MVKQQLIKYHDCDQADCYGPQLERQADVAIAFLKQSIAEAKPGEKLAIVLDIDETALSNGRSRCSTTLATFPMTKIRVYRCTGQGHSSDTADFSRGGKR